MCDRHKTLCIVENHPFAIHMHTFAFQISPAFQSAALHIEDLIIDAVLFMRFCVPCMITCTCSASSIRQRAVHKRDVPVRI